MILLYSETTVSWLTNAIVHQMLGGTLNWFLLKFVRKTLRNKITTHNLFFSKTDFDHWTLFLRYFFFKENNHRCVRVLHQMDGACQSRFRFDVCVRSFFEIEMVILLPSHNNLFTHIWNLSNLYNIIIPIIKKKCSMWVSIFITQKYFTDRMLFSYFASVYVTADK